MLIKISKGYCCHLAVNLSWFHLVKAQAVAPGSLIKDLFLKISNSPFFHTGKPKSLIACISKRRHCRAKWTEIWDLGLLIEDTGIWGTFHLVVFKVIWGSFGTLVIFQKYDFQNAASFSYIFFFFFSQTIYVFPVTVHTKVIS